MPPPEWVAKAAAAAEDPEHDALTTLADVRTLLGHLPADRRKLNIWRHVADRHDNAAGGSVHDAAITSRLVLVLHLENVPCLSQ